MEKPINFEMRRTGKSTSQALSYISTAINNPNKEVRLLDHHSTRKANRHLLNTVNDIIGRLELVGFTINSTHNSISYDPKELFHKTWGFK
jgi:hypothetical protein